MKNENSYRKNLLQYQISTFKYAFNGLKHFFLHETKAIIHSVAAIAAIALGIVFGISAAEWLIVVLVIGAVFTAEIINTAIEHTVDLITQEHNPRAGLIKDLAAGAVLVVSISAMAVGLIIFIPKFVEIL